MEVIIKDIFLSIVMPALNEEDNIEGAIDTTLAAFNKLDIRGEIIVVNDGSTDSTTDKVKSKIPEDAGNVRMESHKTPKGIGGSFWSGVKEAAGNAVCLIPGDNEAISYEILRYVWLLEHVDIVNPYVFNKTVRPKSRIFISSLYLFLVNVTFGTSLKYTNGTVIYRKSLLLTIKCRSKGFFYQTESLIKLIKQGYLYAEVPYSIGKRKSGKSKAFSLSSIFNVFKEYILLIKDIYFSSKISSAKTDFAGDSISQERYQECDN